MTPIQQLIADIEQADFQTLAVSGSPRLAYLLTAGADLFEQYDLADQSIAYAILFGIMIGSIEGQPVDIEQQGSFITYEDRLALFVAQARVACKATIEAATHPDCPKLRTN